jgi:hypothetical protein
MENQLRTYRGSVVGVITVMMLLVPFGEGFAQLSNKTQEVWPSTDVYYRISPKWRLYGTIGGTKLEESSFSDGGVGVYVDHFTFPFGILRSGHADSLPGKFLWLRGGYQYSATPPSSEDPFKENMVVTEANARFYLPYKMLLTWKNRFDWRINNGEFKARYRPRLIVERDMRTDYLFFTAYGFAEYFANFGSGNVNRLKAQLGVEFRVTRIINYEAFWNHQFANEPDIQSVDAFGMCVKFYLSKKPGKQKSKKQTSS